MKLTREITAVVLLAAVAFVGCKGTDSGGGAADTTSVSPGDTAADTTFAFAGRPPASASARLDLTSAETDPNGFMINPRWVMQDGNDTLPNVENECGQFGNADPNDPAFMNGCTTQRSAVQFVRRKSFDVPVPGGKRTVCAADPDHVNWRVGPRGLTGSAAVAVGSLYLDDVALDGDLDFFLRTAGNPGRTSSDPFLINAAGVQVRSGGTAGLELEFLLKEVEQKFETEFWTDLVRAVGRAGGGKDLAAAKDLVNGHTAVAMGVFGVDGVHGAHSEIHPVFSLAIRTVPERRHDRWTIFARTWGTEGECSDTLQRLVLPNNRLMVWIPWRSGATAAKMRFVRHGRAVWQDSVSVPPIAVPITFSREPRPFVEGELIIDWFGPVVDDTRLDEPSFRWKRRQLGDEQIVKALREAR